jgi:hypothetical protein
VQHAFLFQTLHEKIRRFGHVYAPITACELSQIPTTCEVP